MVAHVLTVAPVGYEGAVVEVESDIKKGLPAIQIVGMGTKSVDEAKERVRSAITNSLMEFPTKKITINLAPAELIKDGAHYDLPIALSILVSSGQLQQSEVSEAIFAGELALDGTLRPIKGAVNIAQIAKEKAASKLYVPLQNAAQAALIPGLEIIGANNLKEVYLHLKNEQIITPTVANNPPTKRSIPPLHTFDEIHGQEQAKRALTIAVAGRHNILLSGPPGAGKTMLARVMTSLMPPLTADEQIAVTKLHSLAGEIDGQVISERPFRAPHHTTSPVAIIGGGQKAKPGEISLAHLGVLFLDEIPEYPRSVLEALRQPLEDKRISISRAAARTDYPADFMLVATMNPCPCGYLGDPGKECLCTATQIIAYQKKLSGPLLDRVDLIVNVSRVPNEMLGETENMHNSQHKTALDVITKAREVQVNRYKSSIKYNSSLSSASVRRHVKIDPTAKALLQKASDRLNLSARSYFKIIKVAQTIADMDCSEIVLPHHISEALQYRGVTS